MQYSNPPIPACLHARNPTDPLSISEPPDQDNGEFYVVQERRAADFEAPKLRKGRSGSFNAFSLEVRKGLS